MLRRNVIKNISLVIRFEVICKVSPPFQELLNSVVEIDRVSTLTVLRIDSNRSEDLFRNKCVKTRKGSAFIAVGHKECRNRMEKSAQMVTDTSFNASYAKAFTPAISDRDNTEMLFSSLWRKDFTLSQFRIIGDNSSVLFNAHDCISHNLLIINFFASIQPSHSKRSCNQKG